MNPNKLSLRPAKTDGDLITIAWSSSLAHCPTVHEFKQSAKKKGRKTRRCMRARMKPSPLPLQQTTADESATIYTSVLELKIIKVVVIFKFC
jgi:hypothetical protein